MHYYFDSLPVHPQPKLLESYNSYLIRLAEANQIGQVQSLLRLIWDKHLTMARPADYPPASLGKLSQVANCAEKDLRRTTFYHLGKKFCCSARPSSVGQFLAGSLSQSLRYCPKCVEKHGYYFLPWRFLCLSGCTEHACYLIERCTHCGHTLPLFRSPLKIGICPTCNGDLTTCVAEPLTQNEWSITQSRSENLTFLLTPQYWEVHAPQVLEDLGWHFARLRQKKRLSAFPPEVVGNVVP